METSQIVTIGIFLAGLALSHMRFAAKIEGDSRVLKAQMDAMAAKLTELGTVLVSLADFKGELKVMNERSLLQGKRLDDLQSRWMNARPDL